MMDDAHHWVNDNFLSDFLNDTEQVELDGDSHGGCTDLNLLSADDDNLSSYLSGETCDYTAGEASEPKKRKRTSVSSETAPNPLSQLITHCETHQHEHNVGSAEAGDFAKGQPQRPFIIVTKPPEITNKNRGNSNSKGAIASRERRQRTKQYVSGLETSLDKLTEENRLLREQNVKQMLQNEQLQKEMKFLKAVLANKSGLAALLNNIYKANGLKLSASESSQSDENTPSQQPHSYSCFQTSSDKLSETVSCAVPPSVPSLGRQLQTLSQNAVVCSESVHCVSDKRLMESVGDTGKELGLETSAHSRTSAAAGEHDSFSLETVSGTDSDSDGASEIGTGGICLHILKNSVSIELCALCNHNAVKSRNIHDSS